MKLRTAALTYIVLLALVALAGDFLANQYVVMRGFEKLEHELVEADTRRLGNEFTRMTEDLNTFVTDWSFWDDAYEFAHNGNKQFILSNLPIETYLEQGLNSIVIYDAKGIVKYGRAVNEAEEFNDGLLQSVLSVIKKYELNKQLDKPGRAGFVNLVDGPAMIASRPILKSNGEGPQAGAMIMVKLLTDDVIEAMSHRLELNISVYEVGGGSLATEISDVLPQLEQGDEALVREVDGDTIVGYTMARGIDGTPLLVGKIAEDRSITRHGMDVAHYNTFFLAVVIAAFGGLTFLLLQRRVISRVERLNEQVNRVDIKRETPSHVLVDGPDSIGQLAKNINSMLERLAHDQKALRQTRDELEDRVAERTAELEQANRNLRSLDKAKTRFLSSTSHELRTPLTAIRGFIKLMERRFRRRIMPHLEGVEEARPQIENYLDNFAIIRKETSRLQRIIDGLLDLNLIEAGRMEWRDEDVNVAELVDEAVIAMSGYFMEKPDVDLRTDLAEGLPLLHVDRDKLHQVLLNLLGNAIKFTDEGHVVITVEMLAGNEMLFAVEDTGCGIAQGELTDIFQVLYQGQAERDYVDKPSGTGLGLALCKEIVEHYNGRIWAESEMDKGSVFKFVIPVA